MSIAHWVNSDVTKAPFIPPGTSRSVPVNQHLNSGLRLIGYCFVTRLVSIKSRPVSRVAANKTQTDTTVVQPTH